MSAMFATTAMIVLLLVSAGALLAALMVARRSRHNLEERMHLVTGVTDLGLHKRAVSLPVPVAVSKPQSGILRLF